MVIGLYFCTFLASLFVLVLLLFRYERVSTRFISLSFLIVVQAFGRYLVSISDTTELAWIGYILVYVGGCFCPLIAMVILFRLCKFKMPWQLLSFFAVFSSIVFLLALSIKNSEIYYKSFDIVRGNGFSYIAKEYGPAHMLYSVLMALFFGVFLYCMIYATRNHRKVAFKTICLIAVLGLFIMILYSVERVLKTHISYSAIGYLLGLLITLRYFNRINMFDITTNIANCMEKKLLNGYIEFDLNYHCMGYNEKVVELFPEIEKKWNIDAVILADDSFVYKEIISWIFHRGKEDTKTIFYKDHYYELFVHEISYAHKECVGYMLELLDRTAENKYISKMENYKDDLEKEVKEKTQHIIHMRDMMVLGMASMVESRDNSTGGHIKRTNQVMKIFSRHLLPYKKELGISDNFLEMVTRAAPMHDLGKISVDDEILRKQGKFTPEEYEKMKKHSLEGARIVSQILNGVEGDDFVTLAENVAHYHHEKWDGTGYPEGLKEKDIPLEARLMALADVYDALVSKRCYKDAFSFDKAFSIIEDSFGSHFDPLCGKIFLECRGELEAAYNEWKEQGE